jgi:hypothetical protein
MNRRRQILYPDTRTVCQIGRLVYNFQEVFNPRRIFTVKLSNHTLKNPVFSGNPLQLKPARTRRQQKDCNKP